MKEKSESSSKTYYQKNKEKIKANKKAERDNLADGYVIQLIKNSEELTTATIKDHPELIELKRAMIKLDRAIKKS